VPIRCRTARMGRDALAILEDLDGGCGVAGFELLTGKLIRNTVGICLPGGVAPEMSSNARSLLEPWT
jgi:hypothetical protein